MVDTQKIFMDWLDTCPVVEFRDIVEKKSYTVTKVEEDSAVWIYTVDFAVVKEEDEEQGIYRRHLQFDKHLGCPSYPNCDEAPMGCTVQSGGNVEWYGHRDEENAK